MKFTTENPNMIEDAIKKMEVKGKYLKDGGLLGGKLKDYFYCSLKDNTLSFWNGNTTFIVNYDVSSHFIVSICLFEFSKILYINRDN